MKCPRCRLINPDVAERCDCGYNFRSGMQGERRREPLPRECVELSPDTVLEQSSLAALIQKHFPDCLLSEQDEGKGTILGRPLRRCRWGLFVRRKLLRGVYVSHIEEISWRGKRLRPPYLRVASDAASGHVPHTLFGVARAMVAVGEGEDADLKSELLEYLRDELDADLHRLHSGRGNENLDGA